MMIPRHIETVLVATDFSEGAERAVGWGAQIARPHGARVVLYHGVEPPAPPLLSPVLADLPDEAYEREQTDAHRRLAEAARKLANDGTEVVVDAQPDLGTDTILDRAARHDAQIIVTGTRARHRLANALLGSTATRLIRDAGVPVLTVPPLAADSRPIRNVLIPTDFEIDLPCMMRLLETILGSEAPRVDVTLLHVHETLYQPASPWSAPLILGPRSERAAAAMRRLEETAARLEHGLRRLETVSCGGDAARAIDREAQYRGADLILMAHGRSAASRLLRSSTAERVLAAAPCPVLTIRSRARSFERATPRLPAAAPSATQTPLPSSEPVYP